MSRTKITLGRGRKQYEFRFCRDGRLHSCRVVSKRGKRHVKPWPKLLLAARVLCHWAPISEWTAANRRP